MKISHNGLIQMLPIGSIEVFSPCSHSHIQVNGGSAILNMWPLSTGHVGHQEKQAKERGVWGDCMEVLFMGQAWNTALLSAYNCLNSVTWPCKMQRTLGNVVVFTRKRRNPGDQPTFSATISNGRMVLTGDWQPTQVENIPMYLPFRWSS